MLLLTQMKIQIVYTILYHHPIIAYLGTYYLWSVKDLSSQNSPQNTVTYLMHFWIPAAPVSCKLHYYG